MMNTSPAATGPCTSLGKTLDEHQVECSAAEENRLTISVPGLPGGELIENILAKGDEEAEISDEPTLREYEMIDRAFMLKSMQEGNFNPVLMNAELDRRWKRRLEEQQVRWERKFEESRKQWLLEQEEELRVSKECVRLMKEANATQNYAVANLAISKYADWKKLRGFARGGS